MSLASPRLRSPTTAGKLSRPFNISRAAYGFSSADCDRKGIKMRMRRLILRCVDNENVALALTGVIKGDSFSVGRPFGRSVATARLGALPNTGPIRIRSRLNIGYLFGLSPTRYVRWFNGYIGTSANQTAREEKASESRFVTAKPAGFAILGDESK